MAETAELKPEIIEIEDKDKSELTSLKDEKDEVNVTNTTAEVATTTTTTSSTTSTAIVSNINSNTAVPAAVTAPTTHSNGSSSSKKSSDDRKSSKDEKPKEERSKDERSKDDRSRDDRSRDERSSKRKSTSRRSRSREKRSRHDHSPEIRAPSTRRVYIANVPYDARWQDIKDLFREKIGDCEFIHLFEDEDGKPRGCGLVEFKDPSSVQKALEVMHKFDYKGRKFVVKEDYDSERDRFGRIVKRSTSSTRDARSPPRRHERESRKERERSEPRSHDSSGISRWVNTYGLSPQFLESLGITGPITNSVFVANLDYKITTRKLREVFRMAGRVVSVNLNTDKDGNSRGHGVVTFEHPVEAVQGVSMFNGQVLNDRPLSVKIDRYAEEPETPTTKLPSGLKGIGMGLGAGGQPLTNVTTALSSMDRDPGYYGGSLGEGGNDVGIGGYGMERNNSVPSERGSHPDRFGSNSGFHDRPSGGGGGGFVNDRETGGGGGGMDRGGVGIGMERGSVGDFGSGVMGGGGGDRGSYQDRGIAGSGNVYPERGNLSMSGYLERNSTVGYSDRGVMNERGTSERGGGNIGMFTDRGSGGVGGGGGGGGGGIVMDSAFPPDRDRGGSNLGMVSGSYQDRSMGSFGERGVQYSARNAGTFTDRGGNIPTGGVSNVLGPSGVSGIPTSAGIDVGGGGGGGGGRYDDFRREFSRRDYTPATQENEYRNLDDSFARQNTGPGQGQGQGPGLGLGLGGASQSSVYVRNLPKGFSRLDLIDRFCEAGNIEFAKMSGDGVGLVCFSQQREAQRAIQLFDGSRVDGRIVEVTL
ncbi:hypothetical protein CHUAL_010560 [Chamberlinius hualienensis]